MSHSWGNKGTDDAAQADVAELVFLNVTSDNGQRKAILEDFDSGGGVQPTFKLDHLYHSVTGNTEIVTDDGHGIIIPKDMHILVGASVVINGGSASLELRLNGDIISATKAYDKQTKSVGAPSLNYTGEAKEGDILTFGTHIDDGTWNGLTLAFEGKSHG